MMQILNVITTILDVNLICSSKLLNRNISLMVFGKVRLSQCVGKLLLRGVVLEPCNPQAGKLVHEISDPRFG